MNNESFKSPKINTPISNTTTSTNNNSSNVNTNSYTITGASVSSNSSPLSLSSSATQTYTNCAQFGVAVNAIAAVVNASNNLSVTTPPNAAAVVADAVSSLAAAIIPDTPIVSIAGSTLSEITTTTTSTKTTPTPVPTSKETGSSNKNNINKSSNNKDLQKSSPSSSLPAAIHSSSLPYSTSRPSVKDLDPMSDANSSVKGAVTNASSTAGNAAAAESDNNANIIQVKDNSNGNTAKGSPLFGTAVAKCVALTTESKVISPATTSSQPVVAKSNLTANKANDINIAPSKSKSKDFISESWEESHLKDWDDIKLKELLDEAYSYKNPRDKENKSKAFLQLLEKVKDEDQSYPFCVTSRGARNLSNSIASNSYHHYQENSHYHSHSHEDNHKHGGSLQDLFEMGLQDGRFAADQSFGMGISGNQRTRRQNHNSRQKKYSSSVSSRQREGGSLPSNVNATHQLSIGGFAGIANDILLMQPEGAVGMPLTNASKANKKEQRRNATKAATTTIATGAETKENNTSSSIGDTVTNNKSTTSPTANTASGGDFIIDMGEPMMDIQQQQKILQCKGQDAGSQGHPFYERLANNDKRIPRANIIGSTKGTYFAPTTSHCYVDETVRFNALERNGCTNNGLTSSAIDAKFLPLDENYKSCKSVLGNEGDKSPELLGKSKSNTIYTKVSSPVSGSTILTGTTNNIAALTQRQLDENGNALNEIYQNSSGAIAGSGPTIQINAVTPTAANAPAALLNTCGNVSTSATVTISPHTASTIVSASATVTTTFTSGPSQAKAKAKKKSQQERNTKTVDVESVAGYRGKDPVEELVKYIESSGEDKQTGSKSGDKKKERKKDKEKHQKLKKSNSLEELRSGAKMEVHELKRTAATTENNSVLIRQKSGGGGKQNKNNSSSTADINKNLEAKNPTQTANSRKSDRRSWGNEDLKYLEDNQNANLLNEDKSATAGNPAKERKQKICAGTTSVSSKEEKEMKDKTIERNERNLINNDTPTIITQLEKPDKLEKSEKFDKCEIKVDKSEKQKKKQDIPPNAVTVVDILAIESVLPETAEFHVVTKKKKPKKQKVINNLEETTVTFNRTHNFTMQKTSTFNQQQQQMTVRYKYYHHDNSSNTNSQNYQQPSSQQHQQSSVVAINSYPHNQQHQHQPQHQDNSTECCTNSSDKSRRKSTSSVPPSEKSDSSDLDSVHSLPIESSKANATNATLNTAKNSTQQRIKSIKNNNNSLPVSKNHNIPAPISYADIARTNKEIADAAAAASASGILINNNEISTECRIADAITTIPTTDALNTEEKAAPTANTVTPAATKTHKLKKSQVKQDFPELGGTSAVFNDDKFLTTTVVNHNKVITYSQSLTAVNNHTLHSTLPIQSHGGTNDSLSTSTSDVNTKASPLDHHKNLIVHQHANIPPLQHPQQQILQKSKSVENDSITTSTNSPSSSAATYVASLNSNNLDKQYPALEKTVKRHSSANVTLGGTNQNNETPYNFAAAAKQQIVANAAEQHSSNIINSNKNAALSTSNTNSNIAIQATLIPSNNLTANKKSKEKSPPLLSANNLTLTAQQINSDSCAFNANTPTSVTSLASSKKSRKERQQQLQQQQQHSQQHQSSFENSTQSKQNQNNANNIVFNKRPAKTLLKSSNSLPVGLASSTSTTSANRPAVIILNDDRNSCSCAADNQFTFGDFNEEELKLFDDDNSMAVVEKPRNNNVDVNANQSEEEENYQPTSNNSDVAMKSPCTTYFNDSGSSCSNDMVNNSSSDILLIPSIDASSPNTSFANNNNGNHGGGSLHAVAALNNNQSSDSGIYTDKKSSNSSCSSNSSSGGGSTKLKHKQITPTKEETSNLNSFLSNTTCASVHTSMDNLEVPLPPPQQLETCNDIETAIIAAARAAAKHQQPAPNHSQQHQQSSNSSSFSSSSHSSISSVYHQQQHSQHQLQQQQQHKQYSSNINNSNKNDQNQHPKSHHQSSRNQYVEDDDNNDDNDDRDGDDDDNDNVSFANTPRSRSPSRPRRISIAGGIVANKEFDIHFIPPTTMPIAFSTKQHNDIIVDFIGSAWEEVANSKVTKVYDGQ